MYRIVEGNDLGWFTIHPYSGLVTTSLDLDREIKENFLLKLTAEDRGVQPKTATATLSIQLLDVNDNAPKFQSQEYSINVSESQPIRKPFFSKALAVDPDKEENGTLSYHLAAGQGNVR